MFLPIHLLLAGTWDDPNITLVLPEGSSLPLEGKATIVEGDLGSFVEVKRPGPRSSEAPLEAALLQASGWRPEANNLAAEGVVYLQKGVHHVALSSAEGEGETILSITVGVPIPEEWAFLGLDPKSAGVYRATSRGIVFWDADKAAPAGLAVYRHLKQSGWESAGASAQSATFRKAGDVLSITDGPGHIIVTREEGAISGEEAPPAFTFRMILPDGGSLEVSSPTLDWDQRNLCVTGESSAWSAAFIAAGWQADGPMFRREGRQLRIQTRGARSCVGFEQALGAPWAFLGPAADPAFVEEASPAQLVLEIPTAQAKPVLSAVEAALKAAGWREAGDWSVLASGAGGTFLTRTWKQGGRVLTGERIVADERESLVLRPEG